MHGGMVDLWACSAVAGTEALHEPFPADVLIGAGLALSSCGTYPTCHSPTNCQSVREVPLRVTTYKEAGDVSQSPTPLQHCYNPPLSPACTINN